MLQRLFIFLPLICFSLAHAQLSSVTVTVSPDVKYLKAKMKKNKFSPKFINAVLKDYDTESFGQTIKMNMLTFLNPPSHAVLVTDEGINKSVEFIEANRKAFRKVEKRDKVPASVIAALLWVETKQGKITGHYHVTSVFAHLLQVNRKEVTDQLGNLAIDLEKNKIEKTSDVKKVIRARAKRKAEWAVEQMKALEKLYNKDHKMVKELLGSYAGAFGMTQFIPSSYWTYARALKDGKVADLYNPEDAISSVGNYLKKEGWNSKRQSRKMRALMHYNNSQDYAESILDLGQKIVLEQAIDAPVSKQAADQGLRN
jgi:membrane-bound lytic murein transglycosylase B